MGKDEFDGGDEVDDDVDGNDDDDDDDDNVASATVEKIVDHLQ